ncbi:MAG: helix-turn-helix transcriptional regulator [Gammaproteobacteria bacterium]|nr:helix-turn-helix transcriptional regulator [Gammaproteobacteria bacterium]
MIDSTNIDADAKVRSQNIDAFSERISSLIEEAGGADGGVRRIAQMCGLSEQVIRKWAAGQSDPSRLRLITLARGVNVNLPWLAEGTGPKRGSDVPLNSLDQWDTFVELLSHARDQMSANDLLLLQLLIEKLIPQFAEWRAEKASEAPDYSAVHEEKA